MLDAAFIHTRLFRTNLLLQIIEGANTLPCLQVTAVSFCSKNNKVLWKWAFFAIQDRFQKLGVSFECKKEVCQFYGIIANCSSHSSLIYNKMDSISSIPYGISKYETPKY